MIGHVLDIYISCLTNIDDIHQLNDEGDNVYCDDDENHIIMYEMSLDQ